MIAQNGADFIGCSGTLVSPTVFLMAAHCVTLAPRGATFRVYFGTDMSQASASDWLSAKDAQYSPFFRSADLEAGNDCGVLILQDPVVDRAPIPYNHNPLTSAFRDQPVRVIGYGVNDDVAQTGFGVKRQLNTSISDFDDRVLMIGTTAQTICYGDSGGPLLAVIDGVETIVGVNSFGARGSCTTSGEARVDVCGTWIDSFIPDPSPPTVAVISPQPGAIVASGFAVDFDAHDDRAVASIDTLVNGQLVATVRTAPWQVSIPAGAVAAGAAQIRGIAKDGWGNQTASTGITVQVRQLGDTPGDIGTACGSSSECMQGFCTADGGGFCTRACSGASPCPSNFDCVTLDQEHAQCELTHEHAGCSVLRDARRGSPASLAILLAALALARRGRRR